MLDPIQYEFRFSQNTLADPEPELGAETLRLRLRLQPKVLAPCGSGSTTLPRRQVENKRLSSNLWNLTVEQARTDTRQPSLGSRVL
jgi:hypothetical protein